jgi:FAD/FMN-containing dehydrogenase
MRITRGKGHGAARPHHFPTKHFLAKMRLRFARGKIWGYVEDLRKVGASKHLLGLFVF